MGNTDIQKQLKKKIEAVVNVPSIEIDQFVQSIFTKNISKDEFLIYENEIGDMIYFVHKGAFRTFFKVDLKELNTEFFFENSFAGAFTSFLTGNKTSLNIQAIEDATVSCISKSLLESYYERNSAWYALGKYIFEVEFVKKCKRESDFLRLRAVERYFSLLNHYPGIETRVSGYHIASFLGIQPESLSRIRSSKIRTN